MWLTNNYSTYTSQYLKKEKQPDNETWSVNRLFLEKSYAKCGGETIHRPFSKISKLSKSLNQ